MSQKSPTIQQQKAFCTSDIRSATLCQNVAFLMLGADAENMDIVKYSINFTIYIDAQLSTMKHCCWYICRTFYRLLTVTSLREPQLKQSRTSHRFTTQARLYKLIITYSFEFDCNNLNYRRSYCAVQLWLVRQLETLWKFQSIAL